MSRRIQRQRTKGWRMPPGAIYVGRPSPWGNPFPIKGDLAPWFAVSLGQMADSEGRRTAALIAYRAWMIGKPLPIPVVDESGTEGEFEYSDGRVVKVRDIAVGLGLMMLAKDGFSIPPRPDISQLKGHDLACWCPLDQPCHADVLLKLAAALEQGEETV